MSSENASILWGAVVIDELARAGVRHVVITPGSRSTPLVVAAARHPDIVDHSAIDERSAAFFALGIGLATGSPAALVCTSGTAVSNYAPAVAEADLAGVPMIMLTADRPANLNDAGASQAMDQVGIFGDKVRWFADLGLPAADVELLAHARSRAARAAFVARHERGPVHLNLRFRKPLEQTHVADSHRDAVPAALKDSEAATGRGGRAPWTSYDSGQTRYLPSANLRDALVAARRPVIVVGAPSDYGFWERDELADLVARVADHWDVPVLAETMSGLRLRRRSENILDGDLITADSEFVGSAAPDLVLQIGRWPVNWPVLRWLEQVDAPRIVFGATPNDPAHGAHHRVAAPPHILGELLDELAPREHSWAASWRTEAARLRRAFDALSTARPNLDGHVARRLAEAGTLFVSSSMPLRDLETFVGPSAEGATVFANRGLNGIDGVVSTAAGVSVGLATTVDVLVGDVAFVHDVGGLVTARRTGAQLRIHVVDNDGGRIFDHLPIARHDAGLLDRHFTTAPGLELEEIASAFGFRARTTTVAEFSVQSRDDAEVVIIRAPSTGQADRRDLLDAMTTGDATKADDTSAPPRPEATIHGETPLVLLHGFTGDATTWGPFVEAYDGPTLALDLLGHGGRPAPDSPAHASLAAYVDDVARQLDSHGLESVDLFGYSMGGRVALAFAVTHPDRVRSLVTLGAHPGIEDDDARRARRDHDWALADRLERIELPAFLDEWLDLPIFASLATLGDAWRDASIAQRLRGTARGYAQALRGAGTGSQAPLWDALASLERPLLALAGATDTKYVAIAQQLEERVERATAEIVPEAGHSAHYEQPTRVAELVARFLQTQPLDSTRRNAS